MVGLPATGKTLLSKKLAKYLNWIGHKAKGEFPRPRPRHAPVDDDVVPSGLRHRAGSARQSYTHVSLKMCFSVFRVSDYRRKHVELYSHDLFRCSNSEATEMRKKSAMEAMDDARNYLLQGGQLAVSVRRRGGKAVQRLVRPGRPAGMVECWPSAVAPPAPPAGQQPARLAGAEGCH